MNPHSRRVALRVLRSGRLGADERSTAGRGCRPGSRLELRDVQHEHQQGRAGELLRQWSSWPDARVQQQFTIDKIQEILDLLASDQSEDWDEGDWEDWEEDWDDMEFSDSEGGMNASMEGQGDLAAGAEMQALPVPNYSVEDILMEEQGSLQFRQQQRAAANEGKVEKDW